MAYVTVTNGAAGQIMGYDTNNTSNVTVNLSPDNLKTTVTSLEAALKMAKTMATAFGVDVSDTTASATSGTTSSGATTNTSGGTVTSGGSAS